MQSRPDKKLGFRKNGAPDLSALCPSEKLEGGDLQGLEGGWPYSHWMKEGEGTSISAAVSPPGKSLALVFYFY